MKYTTLLMDADDTIFDFPACEYNALKAALESNGLVFSEEVFLHFDNINTILWRRFEKAEITRSELRVERFRKLIGDCFDGFDDSALLADNYIEELAKQNVLIDGTLDAIKALSEIYDIYVITNGITSVQKGRFSSSPVTRYINGLFISDEMNVQKPDKAFFELVMSSIPEKDISRLLVVGDSLTSDMQGGRNAGIDTCLFDPHDKIKMPHPLCDMKIKDLRELLI